MEHLGNTKTPEQLITEKTKTELNFTAHYTAHRRTAIHREKQVLVYHQATNQTVT
jgi:hypothetical protein